MPHLGAGIPVSFLPGYLSGAPGQTLKNTVSTNNRTIWKSVYAYTISLFCFLYQPLHQLLCSIEVLVFYRELTPVHILVVQPGIANSEDSSFTIFCHSHDHISFIGNQCLSWFR